MKIIFMKKVPKGNDEHSVDYLNPVCESELKEKIDIISDDMISVVEKAISEAETDVQENINYMLYAIQAFEKVVKDRGLRKAGATTSELCDQIALGYYALIYTIDDLGICISPRITRHIQNNISTIIRYFVGLDYKRGQDLLTSFYMEGFNPFPENECVFCTGKVEGSYADVFGNKAV